MSAALAIAARDALRRLAREQDDAGVLCPDVGDCHACAVKRRALTVIREETFCAVEALWDALPEEDETSADEAEDHKRALRQSSAIPSATLRTMADGWDSYAASFGCAYASTSGVCGEPVAAGAARCPRHT